MQDYRETVHDVYQFTLHKLHAVYYKMSHRQHQQTNWPSRLHQFLEARTSSFSECSAILKVSCWDNSTKPYWRDCAMVTLHPLRITSFPRSRHCFRNSSASLPWRTASSAWAACACENVHHGKCVGSSWNRSIFNLLFDIGWRQGTCACAAACAAAWMRHSGDVHLRGVRSNAWPPPKKKYIYIYIYITSIHIHIYGK